MPPSKHAAKTPEVTLRRLLRAWNVGDEEAGRQLFELLADDVTRFFRSKLFDQHAVEDLVQETFLKVRVANSEVHTTARGFVFGVAFNTLRHHLRGRQRAGVRHQRLAWKRSIGISVPPVCVPCSPSTCAAVALAKLPERVSARPEIDVAAPSDPTYQAGT